LKRNALYLLDIF